MTPLPAKKTILQDTYTRITPLIKNKKTVSYVTLSLSLFTLSFFGLFAIRPTLITAISLTKSVSELRKLKDAYENKIGDIIRAQSEYEKIRPNLPVLKTAIPEDPKFPALAKGLERFAATEKVLIDSLQISDVPISKIDTTGDVQSYDFNIELIGDYANLSAYINHLINWKRIVTLSSIEYLKDTATQSANLHLSLKGTVYYEP